RGLGREILEKQESVDQNSGNNGNDETHGPGSTVRLADAGVDMFNLSNFYHTAQRTDIAAVRATALRSPRGQTTVYLLNKSSEERNASLTLAGVTKPLTFRQYQVTEDG